MSISKLNISQKLIEGFVKVPPSLKEQSITKLAIQLCQNVELKEDILCVSEPLQNSDYISYTAWANLIEKRTDGLFERLSLTSTLKNPLFVRTMSMAMQLFNWNKQHQEIFHSPPLLTNSLLTPSDWTVEGRLNEKQIAKRVLQNNRIPVCRRFRLACFHFLEASILSLWSKVSPECRLECFASDESKLIQLWCNHLTNISYSLFEHDERFWKDGLKAATREGSRLAVIHCWEQLSESAKNEVIIEAATETMSMFIGKNNEDWGIFSKMYFSRWAPSTEQYADIFYFLFSEMSPDQRVSFFREMIATHHDVLDRLLQWPYQDLFMPVISKLWDFLPESNFADQLLQIAIRYNDISDSTGKQEITVYDYGDLLIKLLEQCPEHFKRYVFNCDKTSICVGGSDIEANIGEILLLEVIVKKSHEYRDMNIFQRILKQITVKEKDSFIRSGCGEKICRYLAMSENWYLLDWTLQQCLSDHVIVHFKKQFLLSNTGIRICFWKLIQNNEEHAKSLFNWATLSSEEISEIKTKLLGTHFQDELLIILQDSCQDNQIDMLDNLMRTCLSDEAQNLYKEHFIERNAISLCIHFITCSDWEKAMHFLNWCFSSADDKLQFKRKLFDGEGVSLETKFISNGEWHDAEHFIQWFGLSPEEIKKLKRDVLFSFEVIDTIFCSFISFIFGKEDLGTVVMCFKWGLYDQEIAYAFKEALMIHAKIYEEKIKEEQLQLIRIGCDELIRLRLRDLEPLAIS